MKIRHNGITLTLLASALLTACGGGGGGGAAAPTGPVVSTLSFPLQSAYKTLVANGFTKTFTVSGTCSGTGSDTVAPASTAATFEGAAALSAAQTVTMSVTNCSPASNASTVTDYYDSNYLPLGFNDPGTNYGLYLTAPTIPTSVAVGGTGIIGTETLYTNSTKATNDGRVDISYLIEADTATTAIVNIISKRYNSTSSFLNPGALNWTQQSRSRISASGALTKVSLDIQYFLNHTTQLNSTTHLVLTYN